MEKDSDPQIATNPYDFPQNPQAPAYMPYMAVYPVPYPVQYPQVQPDEKLYVPQQPVDTSNIYPGNYAPHLIYPAQQAYSPNPNLSSDVPTATIPTSGNEQEEQTDLLMIICVIISIFCPTLGLIFGCCFYQKRPKLSRNCFIAVVVNMAFGFILLLLTLFLS